jgi:hypothetical protein
MPSVLAQAIARQEGFGVSGSVAQRDNNPGNLMSPPGGTWAGQTGVDSSGFAVFGNAQDGWNALDTDISSNAGLTLSQFISKYAPSSENNTSAYISNVSSWTGASPDETVADILSGNYSDNSSALPAGTVAVPDTMFAGIDLSTLSSSVSDWWSEVADSMNVDPTTLGIGAGILALALVWYAMKD